jgi:hypothetical protein
METAGMETAGMETAGAERLCATGHVNFNDSLDSEASGLTGGGARIAYGVLAAACRQPVHGSLLPRRPTRVSPRHRPLTEISQLNPANRLSSSESPVTARHPET